MLQFPTATFLGNVEFISICRCYLQIYRPGIQHRHVLSDGGQHGQEGGGGGRQYPEPRLHSQVSQPQRKQGERYVDQQCCQVAH